MKKMLLISYYFPPCGGAGVQRWLRILRYLSQMGWDITVLTTYDGDYPTLDESLVNEIPNNIQVVRSKTPVFGSFYKKVTKDRTGLPYGTLNSTTKDKLLKRILYWIRINFIVPDARIIWNKYAYKKAVNIIQNQGIRLVVTTSPPHSTQLIGWKLKRKYQLKWITDLRDPWADIYYLKLAKQNKIAYYVNKYLEKKIVKNADLNLIVSDYIRDSLPKGNKVTLTNSFDQNNFSGITKSKTKKFRIKYVGKVTAGQDINSIVSALNKLSDINQNIEFTFIGTYLENPFNTSFSVLTKNYLPHAKAIEEMVNSELLILLINDYPQNKGMLTTKLFEYLGAQVPILCIGPLDGDANKIIQECQAGICHDYGDVPAIRKSIKNFYTNWLTGERLTQTKNLNYSIGDQINKLNLILEKMLEKKVQ